MTPSQLRRISKPVFAARIEDLEESLQVALATASAPPEPAIAARTLALAARDRLAGVALGLIEAGELCFRLGRWCATACRWTRLRLPLLKGGAVNRP